MKSTKFRHEYKHYISIADCKIMQNRLKYIMTADPHAGPKGCYHIRSLYFDTPEDHALLDKINGVDNREKFRIRFYNHDYSYINLEKKIKSKSLVAKSSVSLTKKQCESILTGDIVWMKDSSEHLLNELYVKIQLNQLKPKVIVDYVRQAFILKSGNVRVTIDQSIKTGLSNTNLFNNSIPMLNSIDPRVAILEIKFDEFLPDIVNDIIQLGDRQQSAASKYALCRAYS